MTNFETDFTKADPWRVFRIMSEFVDGFETMSTVKNGVGIFGSARSKPSTLYYKKAEETAYLLAKAGYSVITGAGPGIMEAANKGAKKAKGESIGLNILIPEAQAPNKYVTKLLEFKYFFCRKVMFAKYSNAFIVFPGGYGTFDEFFEAVTLVQTDRMERVPIVLFGKKYWKGMISWLKNMVIKNGMVKKDELNLFRVVDTPEDVLKVIRNFK